MSNPTREAADTQEMIERSSLGAPGAVRLRQRTSHQRADAIVERAQQVRWPERTLLSRLPPDSRRGLLALGEFREFPPSTQIIREGDQTTFALVLLSGWAKVTALTDDGGVALLAVRHGGDLIGEFSAIDGKPRGSTITAVSQVRAKVLSSDELASYLAADPTATAAVSQTIVAKTRFSIRRRVEFAGCSVAVRVARVLVELDRAYGSDRPDGARLLDMPLTQADLSALVGAKDPTVHKALRELRSRGVIETGYRRFAILDLAALREAAGLGQPHSGQQATSSPAEGTGPTGAVHLP
ncbi:Crp/Fnr family transcriptional regulator [Pseudofrankia inefficax]|nr:Crp/Fnr family transcriptional regulator [Pseudofrankia inefficax]